MTQRVALEILDGVAHVRLTRADKMNALDPAMFDALLEIGARLAAATDLRAVVLSGEGRAFCAGLDLGSFEGAAQGGGLHFDLLTRSHGDANAAQQIVLQWRQLPVPVIAAAHGVAFGGGFQLLLGADMRFLQPQAQLSLMEIKWGLVPDMAGMLLMRGLVRPDIMADLVYSGRVFTGLEAERYGLATRLCEDPVAEALTVAREIAGKSPPAIRAAKRLLRISDEGLAARILLAESVEQTGLFGSPAQMEAVRAALAPMAIPPALSVATTLGPPSSPR